MSYQNVIVGRRLFSSALLVAAAGAWCMATAPASGATISSPTRPVQAGGTLVEHAPQGSRVKVTWTITVRNPTTGKDENIDTSTPSPTGWRNVGAQPGGGYGASFPIPKTGSGKDSSGNQHNSTAANPIPISDAHQVTETPGNRASAGGNRDEDSPIGAANSLAIAAWTFDGSNYAMLGPSNFVQDTVGDDHEVMIPDLFADTNGDGMKSAGDILYTSVNLVDYFPVHTSWMFGQMFNIVNGLCPELPGMSFGTAPITFGLVDGRTGSAGSSGLVINPEPYTGQASVDAAHGIVTPTPGAGALLALGALAGIKRRHR